MSSIHALLLFLAMVANILALTAWLSSRSIERSAPKKVEAIANRAYSKAQQALENSVEAVQIAKDEVPEKKNKPCNSKFGYGHKEFTCNLPKYPGHNDHAVI